MYVVWSSSARVVYRTLPTTGSKAGSILLILFHFVLFGPSCLASSRSCSLARSATAVYALRPTCSTHNYNSALRNRHCCLTRPPSISRPDRTASPAVSCRSRPSTFLYDIICDGHHAHPLLPLAATYTNSQRTNYPPRQNPLLKFKFQFHFELCRDLER